MDDLKEIKQELKEIRSAQHTTNVELAKYNTLLDVHIKGVRDLDSRIKPIEEHVQFMRTLGKAIGKMFGLVVGIMSITSVLIKLFVKK